MANNPFYPGYSPKKADEGSFNPLYPGYYAGQPIQRRPVSKDFVKPIEYNTDVLMGQIDEVAEATGAAVVAAPKWVVDRIVNDFKDSLKVAIKPPDIDITELSDYEMEDFPGAVGISISLNPLDYIKDPKKQVIGTLQDWFNSATGVNTKDLLRSDFGDIENKTRHLAWETALGYGAERTPLPFETEAAESIVERMTSLGLTPEPYLKAGAPLDVSGVNIDSYPVNENGTDVQKPAISDLYKDTVRRVGEFESYRGSKSTPKKSNELLEAALPAINAEVASKYNNGINNGSDALKNRLAYHSGAVEFSAAKNDILVGLAKLNGDITYRNKNLAGLGTASGVGEIGELQTSITKTRDRLNTNLSAIEKLKNDGKISLNGYNDLKKITDDYRNYLEKLNTTVTSIGSKGLSGKDARREMTAFLRDPYKTKLTGGDILTNSIEQRLSMNIEFSMLSTKERKNIHGALIQDHIGSLLRDETLQGLGMEVTGSKLVPVLYRLRRERIAYATEEFLESMDKGKILENYLWNNRVKPILEDKVLSRIKAYLPSTYVSNFLEERNNFGLQITKPGMARLKRLDAKDGGSRYVRAAEKYGFKVEVKFDYSFSQSWGLQKHTFVGGDQFKFLNNKGLGAFDLSISSDRNLMKGLLTGSYSNDELARKLFGGLSLSEVMTNEAYKKQLDDFKNQATALKEWYEKNKNLFGPNADNPDFQLALFEQLLKKNKSLPHGYKLTREFIGGFEKIHMRLQQLNTWFITSKFGKMISALKNWKDIVSNKVAALLSSAISKIIAGAAATTGFLAVLVPVIEKLISFTINKILGYGEAVLKGILKGDFSDLAKMLDKEVKKVLRLLLVGCALALSPTIIFVFIFFSLFGTTVSPIDRTASSAVVVCHPNTNSYFSVQKTYNYNGTYAKYTVTITPNGAVSKIPVGTEITYSDYVAVIKSETNPSTGISHDVATTLYSNGPIPLPNYTSQQVITYDVPIDSSDPNLQNARIQNFFTVSIPKLSDNDIDTCHDQVVVASKSFSIGNAPSEMDMCAGYEIPGLVCEGD